MADYNDTPDFDFSDIPGYDHLAKFVEIGERAERQAKIKEDILFAGQDKPPMAELEIIFDRRLTFVEQVAKLQVLRGEKQVKPKSFKKRLTDSDRIRTRAMGIKL